jgi:hypothetical protein
MIATRGTCDVAGGKRAAAPDGNPERGKVTRCDVVTPVSACRGG